MVRPLWPPCVAVVCHLWMPEYLSKNRWQGLTIGLVKEEKDEIILSDILGDEDHLGDMDFKIAGTRDAITAIQMDIKIKGISKETMRKAVIQGQRGIGTILDTMTQTLEKPRESMSPYAPRIFTIRIKPDKIRDVIGQEERLSGA